MRNSIETYNKAVQRIIEDFIDMYYACDDDSRAEYYIIGEGGNLAPDVIEVNDMYWNISDMYTAVKNCLEKDKVMEWYDYQLDKHTINSNGGDDVILNLHSYCKGAIIHTKEELEEISKKAEESRKSFYNSLK